MGTVAGVHGAVVAVSGESGWRVCGRRNHACCVEERGE